HADQITEIRKRGGDVIISFGGWGGKELAVAEKDATKLEAKYAAVIDKYKFSSLDFDIENKGAADDEANQRRNAVLMNLQKKNPTLRVSYTLPVAPSGLGKHSL